MGITLVWYIVCYVNACRSSYLAMENLQKRVEHKAKLRKTMQDA